MTKTFIFGDTGIPGTFDSQCFFFFTFESLVPGGCARLAAIQPDSKVALSAGSKHRSAESEVVELNIVASEAEYLGSAFFFLWLFPTSSKNHSAKLQERAKSTPCLRTLPFLKDLVSEVAAVEAKAGRSVFSRLRI